MYCIVPFTLVGTGTRKRMAIGRSISAVGLGRL